MSDDQQIAPPPTSAPPPNKWVIGPDGIPDLTNRTKTQPRPFRLGPDVFQCARTVPAEVVRTMAKLREQASLADQVEAFLMIADQVLLHESAEKFAARMGDPDNPIGLEDIATFMDWMMEEYTGHPQRPSQGSSPQPNGTGPSSTVGAVVETSILSNSQPVDIST